MIRGSAEPTRRRMPPSATSKHTRTLGLNGSVTQISNGLSLFGLTS